MKIIWNAYVSAINVVLLEHSHTHWSWNYLWPFSYDRDLVACRAQHICCLPLSRDLIPGLEGRNVRHLPFKFCVVCCIINMVVQSTFSFRKESVFWKYCPYDSTVNPDCDCWIYLFYPRNQFYSLRE